MNVKNRQIKTGEFQPNSETMQIEVLMTGTVNGEAVKAGQVITCTKSQGRRYFEMNAKMFKVLVD